MKPRFKNNMLCFDGKEITDLETIRSMLKDFSENNRIQIVSCKLSGRKTVSETWDVSDRNRQVIAVLWLYD